MGRIFQGFAPRVEVELFDCVALDLLFDNFVRDRNEKKGVLWIAR